jgi:hypothetical protein
MNEVDRQFSMGVDPGYSGAIAVLCGEGNVVSIIRLDDTEHDVATQVAMWSRYIKMAYLEQVSAMPRQGVSSTFKFGTSYGFCRALLVCHAIPFTTVTPSKWQGDMKCRSKGDKNVTKAAAQCLFPGQKVTHRNADALLIAEYGRRKWSST